MRKLVFVMVMACATSIAFAPKGAAINQFQFNTKESLSSKIDHLPDLNVSFDNTTGSSLVISSAYTKSISESDYRNLTGDLSGKPSWRSAFPRVTLTNTTGKTILKWGVAIKSSADEDSNRLRGIKVYQHPILPNASYVVESTHWPIAERLTVMEGGKAKTVLKAPGYDSPKRWLPGASNNLKVIVTWVEFEGGEIWNCPANFKFFN